MFSFGTKAADLFQFVNRCSRLKFQFENRSGDISFCLKIGVFDISFSSKTKTIIFF